MNKDKLIEWLDYQVLAQKLITTPFNEKIRCIQAWSDMPEIHISPYSIIPEMAKTLGITYDETDDGTDEYPLTRSFNYKGYTVFAQAQRNTDD